MGEPIRETLIGTERSWGFSIMPLKDAVRFCEENIYSYEPALEMLNEMYGLGLEVGHRESRTSV